MLRGSPWRRFWRMEQERYYVDPEGRGSDGHRGRRRGGRRGGSDGGPFGGRRPLRFIARKLGLNDEQFAALARAFESIKTERMQADVDRRRAAAALADVLAADEYDAKAAAEAEKLFGDAAARVAKAFTRAVEDLHPVLDASQRQRLASLLRRGPKF